MGGEKSFANKKRKRRAIQWTEFQICQTKNGVPSRATTASILSATWDASKVWNTQMRGSWRLLRTTKDMIGCVSADLERRITFLSAAWWLRLGVLTLIQRSATQWTTSTATQAITARTICAGWVRKTIPELILKEWKKKMKIDFNQTVFEKMRGTRFPEYYDTMYLDGAKPWEILEAAHRSIIKEHEAR